MYLYHFLKLGNFRKSCLENSTPTTGGLEASIAYPSEDLCARTPQLISKQLCFKNGDVGFAFAKIKRIPCTSVTFDFYVRECATWLELLD